MTETTSNATITSGTITSTSLDGMFKIDPSLGNYGISYYEPGLSNVTTTRTGRISNPTRDVDYKGLPCKDFPGYSIERAFYRKDIGPTVIAVVYRASDDNPTDDIYKVDFLIMKGEFTSVEFEHADQIVADVMGDIGDYRSARVSSDSDTPCLVVPDQSVYGGVIDDYMYAIYDRHVNWSYFPKEKSYENVKKLEKLFDTVGRLRDELSSKRLDNAIAECRERLKSVQEKISELEKEQTEMYEKGAEALNELEKMGYPQDVNDIKDPRPKKNIMCDYAIDDNELNSMISSIQGIYTLNNASSNSFSDSHTPS